MHPINRWLVNGSIALAVMLPSVAQAAELTHWQFDPATQQLQVTVPAGTTPRYFMLAQPARIVLDLPNTQVGNVAAQQSFAGAVRQIRVGQFDATSTRIVIELAPDAVLAPTQVELQQASASSTGTEWVLRPLLADSPVAAQPAPTDAPSAAIASVPPAEAPAAPTASVPPPDPAEMAIAPAPVMPVAPAAPIAAAPPLPSEPAPSSAEMAIAPAPVAEAPLATTSLPTNSLPAAAPSEAAAQPSDSAPTPEMPPLEPNAIEIPIAPPAPAAAPVEPVETAVLPSNSATSTIPITGTPQISSTLTPPAAEPSLPARDPILLPPAAPIEPEPATPANIQVPPLSPSSPAPRGEAIAPTTPTDPPDLQATAPIDLPPARLPQAATPSVTVPPLNAPSPSAQPSQPQRSVEFGQPPAEQALRSPVRRDSVLLTAGTVLRLRYPRETVLELDSDQPRQEVLVLQEAVQNAEGEVVLPAGTQVVGRFEADASGSRFVTQAVTLADRNLRLNAESAVLERDRHVSQNDLLVHSAVGALALTLLGGFSGLGLVGGAAAGAATTYLSPPDAIMIQPNQVFEVRLTQDLPR